MKPQICFPRNVATTALEGVEELFTLLRKFF